ncbi:MAG: L-arabinose ABC transporter permease AraH [Armatimonadetes bacterium]|nr:L-arabinose ABC transporter permease AraH [Armatimonadota bacterium]
MPECWQTSGRQTTVTPSRVYSCLVTDIERFYHRLPHWVLSCGAVKTQARRLFDNYGMTFVALALFIVCSAAVPNFLTVRNMIGLSVAVSMVGMVACTMMFCLAAGDVDLSVGTLVPCAGVIVAVVLKQTGSLAEAVVAALGFGVLVGLLNGFAVAKLRIGALIATLATMQIVKSFSLVISGGKAVGIAHEGFNNVGSAFWPVVSIGEFRGVPVPVWITVGCMVVFAVLLSRSVFGRNTLAIGGNPEAAQLAGIQVTKTRMAIFVLQGFVAALAGLVLAARLTSGQPNSAQGFELEVIAACVLGGVSLSGGIASMAFVVAGVVIMGIVQNAMNLLQIEPFYQYMVRGAILLVAVALDKFKRR